MSKIPFRSLPALCLGLVAFAATAAGPARDWLVDPAPYRARVTTNEAAGAPELELSNGLVRRVIRLGPNAATVALDHLGTGEGLLRGVKPEAVVVIDGRRMEVGGLKGQPNYAFLRRDWLPSLKADPSAFRYVGHAVGVPDERLAWKRVRHHAPDVQWPPRGVSLRLDFAWPQATRLEGLPSEAGRELVWADPFRGLDPAWKVQASRHAERISFQNEGKAGEIFAPVGAHCFAERPLPASATLVEAVIHPGTDTDASWGPGLGLVFPGRVVEVSLRPGDRGTHGQFELRDGGSEQLARLKEFTAADGGLDVARAYRIRARWDGGRLVWDVADGAQSPAVFVKLFELELDGPAPVAVRVGKTDRRGGAGDSIAPDAPWGRSRVTEVRVFGRYDAARAAREAGAGPRDVGISVHYELYDGLPVWSKWITVSNRSDRPIRLDGFASELLAVVERVSEVDELSDGRIPPNLHVETDMAFGGMMAAGANRRSYRWLPDPDFHTQVNYEKRTPCLLEVGPDIGPAQEIAPGGRFESYRAWILPQDSTDRERCGLAVRRLYRTVAPWTTENPLMMHVVSSNGQVVTNAIEQCARTGFEMVILSFGSGFNMEDERPATMAKAQAFASHARKHGIEIGSYSLLASRSVGGGNDVVMPPGEKPAFGNSPCLCSRWGTNYFRRLYEFHRESGFTLLEHDGSYPGDVCAATNHPGHRGLADSRWNQWAEIAGFYRWSRAQGFYLNVPDHYFMSGSSKTGMGYREVNWSLPRAQQVIHTRQNIYDGTWQKLPSMGWMFVPLTEYQGGGAAATIEPLDQHLDHYARMIESNLALGVQACYRGPRLYDTERTRRMVASKVAWFRAHRDILESDLIHGRRADARDLDWMLHVNPRLREKGMLVVFNPLDEPVTRRLRVSVYYTGLHDRVRLRDADGRSQRVRVARDHTIEVDATVPAQSMRWWVLE